MLIEITRDLKGWRAVFYGGDMPQRIALPLPFAYSAADKAEAFVNSFSARRGAMTIIDTTIDQAGALVTPKEAIAEANDAKLADDDFSAGGWLDL